MHVEIRSHNIRMPRAHSQGLAQQVRTAFARLAHRIVRIVLDVGAPAAAGPAAARECVIEVRCDGGARTPAQARSLAAPGAAAGVADCGSGGDFAQRATQRPAAAGPAAILTL
jgi:hypothetical protein